MSLIHTTGFKYSNTVYMGAGNLLILALENRGRGARRKATEEGRKACSTKGTAKELFVEVEN
jgi:hypothetical protein